jgi:hypothetical protein
VGGAFCGSLSAFSEENGERSAVISFFCCTFAPAIRKIVKKEWIEKSKK